mmetsp:Transcript_3445/g.21594  ORF Transcript_3445/g.21594 Transcript_3445/m.21594 type:complete len:419 (+) Transcript_3445:35-1291(+)
MGFHPTSNASTGHWEAIKVDTVEPHHGRVEAPCPSYGICNGCMMQDLDVERQNTYKKQQVEDLFRRIGKVKVLPPVRRVGETNPHNKYGYRNKVEFSFADEHGSNQVHMGFHKPGSRTQVLDVETCLLQDDTANQIWKHVRQGVQNRGIANKHMSRQKRYLEHVVIRRGNQKYLVNLVTGAEEPQLLQDIAHALYQTFPLHGVVNSIRKREREKVKTKVVTLAGVDYLEQDLGHLTLKCSANSFFQPNTEQAEKLYEEVERACSFSGRKEEVLLDLFCGTGSIGLYMARACKHVYGYEIVEQSVLDARRNATMNSINNAQFFQGDLAKIAGDIGKTIDTPDIVIVDPNRPGLDGSLVEWIARSKVPRVVYVSCNPATQARDLQRMMEIEPRYGIDSVAMVDMAPHTPHIETVASLSLR